MYWGDLNENGNFEEGELFTFAEPEIRLCESGAIATTLTGACCLASAMTAPMTAPAPALSVCMNHAVAGDGLTNWLPVRAATGGEAS